MGAGSSFFGCLSVFVDPKWPNDIRPVGGGEDGFSFSLTGSAGFFFGSFSDLFSLTDFSFSTLSSGSRGSLFKSDAAETTSRPLPDPRGAGAGCSVAAGGLPRDGAVGDFDAGSSPDFSLGRDLCLGSSSGAGAGSCGTDPSISCPSFAAMLSD